MDRFVPATPAAAASSLAPDAVHLWLLPYDRAAGRRPLRDLLGAYLELPGERIGFTTGPHGRPACAAATEAGLDFNWSHSGARALAAIARGLPELGVDLELPRPRARALTLARRFFAPEEHDALSNLAPEALAPAFLRLWTAKEAVLKALGEGLQYGLHRVVFTLDDAGIRPSAFQGSAAPATAWRLHAVPAPGACACVAWRGGPRTVHLFSSNPP